MAFSRGRTDSRREAVEESPYRDRVVTVNRVAKVVKCGRRVGFNALVVIGDGAGQVGVALGKANEVSEAVRKGVDQAKKNLFAFPIINGTIPHAITVKKGAAKVMLKPAAPGTGVIAGGPIRALMELGGVQNVLTKSLGTDNPYNVIGAAVAALKLLVSIETVSARRGKTYTPRPKPEAAPAATPPPTEEQKAAKRSAAPRSRPARRKETPGAEKPAAEKPAVEAETAPAPAEGGDKE